MLSPSFLHTLEYGPAPESDSAARAWIASHEGKFGLFINNEFVHPEDRAYSDTLNPARGEVLASIIEGDPHEDVNRAVDAATTAFRTWSQTSGYERAKVLYAMARQIQKHRRLLAVVESLDNGKTIRETRDADTPLCVRHFYYHAGWAQLMESELREYAPVGVIAQVIPWNFPLLMMTWKIAPALAMGNTVVLKPAPSTRLSALLLAEIAVAAGVPPGVINVLPGGNDLGYQLVNHPGVAKVAFTGSTGVGRKLRECTAGTGKKLSLELGGKAPFIVFDDADLDSAVEGVVDAIWFNGGQVCCAGSRLLVQESVYPRFLAKLQRRMENLRVGEPLDKTMDMGAINSPEQWARIHTYVQLAREEGASIHQSPGCPDKPAEGPGGLYYPPTLIYDIEASSRCVVEEIFGPVVVMMAFRSPSEAVALGNNTAYGLSGSVWTETVGKALDVAFQIKAGVVWINAHNLFDAAAGFGGYKESGFGRESGKEGLYEYLQLKSAQASPALPLLTEEEKSAPWGTDDLSGPAPLHALSAAAADTTRPIDKTLKMFYGGKQARPDGDYTRAILSPQGQLVGEVPEGNRKDIRNAVAAAASAASGWGKRAAFNRAQILFYVAENLEMRQEEFATCLDRMTGEGLDAARTQVQQAIERLFFWAAWADKCGGEVKETPLYGATVAVHEPVGVIGIACPDEAPLLSFVSLMAPAIVRGNVVVMVPSEKYPLVATLLYQVFSTSDVPPGVVNVLTGSRDMLAGVMAVHMQVQAMWYFGTHVGSYHVERLSAHNLKRTLVNYGRARRWDVMGEGAAWEFLYHATQVKNIWIPAGV